MAQMARELGLSLCAVSCVVNGRAKQARLSDRTVQRVNEHLARRGFVPSRYARHLQASPKRITGILYVGTMVSHLGEAFYKLVELLGGKEQGVETCLTPVDRVESAVQELLARRVTDLVWIHDCHHGGEEYRHGMIRQYLMNMRTIIYNFPFSFVSDEQDLVDHGFSVIGIDRLAQGRDLARFLKKLGHRVVALPGVPRRSLFLRHIKLFEDEGLTVADFPFDFTVNNMRKVMKEQQVTAVCFHGDSPACLALCALRAEGIRVPEDLTVLGFDGMSRQYYPDLTTQLMPVGAMVEKVRDILSGVEPERRHCFNVELVPGRTHQEVSG